MIVLSRDFPLNDEGVVVQFDDPSKLGDEAHHCSIRAGQIISRCTTQERAEW